MAYVGAPPRPDGVYDLLVDGRLAGQAERAGGNVRTIDMATGSVEHRRRARRAPSGSPACPPASKDVEIWLPHNEITELVALRTDAPVEPRPDRAAGCGCTTAVRSATAPTPRAPPSTWPALAASAAAWSWSTSGFGGSALLDPFTARAMRDTPADLISVKIGINLVNTDLMRLRAFAPAVHGFLDTIREGHPTTPLLVVSPILCPIHEDTPGPSAPDLSRLSEGRLGFGPRATRRTRPPAS